MRSEKSDCAIRPGDADGSLAHAGAQRQAWTIITGFLAGAIFLQAVFAGAMLSGDAWARSAHSLTAIVLTASAIGFALVAIVTLRRSAHGPKLALALAGLAVVIFAQTAIGNALAGGRNLLWLHVPLGVALVGLATRALSAARILGAP